MAKKKKKQKSWLQPKAKKLTYSCTTKFCHVHQFSPFTDWADELHFIAFYHVLSLTGMKLKRKFFTLHTKNKRGHKLLRVLAMRKSITGYSQAWGHSHCKEFEPYQPVQMWQNHFHIASCNGNRDIIYFIPHINVPVGISHLS